MPRQHLAVTAQAWECAESLDVAGVVRVMGFGDVAFTEAEDGAGAGARPGAVARSVLAGIDLGPAVAGGAAVEVVLVAGTCGVVMGAVCGLMGGFVEQGL